MGLPSRRLYNIDRELHCARVTGGCLIDGNEWLTQAPHIPYMQRRRDIMANR